MAAEALTLIDGCGASFVSRGSGTSLAGGCLTSPGSVAVCTARMRRMLEVNCRDGYATVEAGVITQHITDAVASSGFRYAPDPSSQTTCTIGGNVANNAGGPHTLKVGVTANHVLGMKVVLPDGRIARFGGHGVHSPGMRIHRGWVGTEGTLGLITEVTVRLVRACPARRTILAAFETMDAASSTVSRIISRGIVPAALEMMDRGILELVEAAYHLGFPTDAAAALIIEIDGIEASLDAQMKRITDMCEDGGAIRIEPATDPEAQALLWKARKTAFGSIGRASPHCITQDGVVPRSQLPHILRFVERVAQETGLRVVSNFHAGDGNIHPNFLFDAACPEALASVHEASDRILAECVRVGGSVTGEHGIGIEKTAALGWMYTPSDLAAQQRWRRVFDPKERANPGKVFTDGGSAT
jgi:glycolate oxidase